MTKILHKMPAALLIVVVAGCSSSDERLARMAMESTERQAEQNREMSQLNREVAEGTRSRCSKSSILLHSRIHI